MVPEIGGFSQENYGKIGNKRIGDVAGSRIKVSPKIWEFGKTDDRTTFLQGP